MDNGVQQVYSDGIYHGLPIIPENNRNLSAIVVGASGMSGQSQIDVLLQSPQRFKKVFALSRRSPQVTEKSGALQHVPVDLLGEPADTAKKLRDGSVQA